MSVTPVWKSSGNGDVSAEYDPKTAMSSLSYSLSGRDVQKTQTWTFTNTQIPSEYGLLGWDYSGFHSWFQAYIKISLVFVKKDGTSETKVLMDGKKSGLIAEKGHEAVALENCKEYYFQIEGRNFDRDMRLLGTLKVNDIVPEDPEFKAEGPGEVDAKYDAETDTSDLSYSLSGNSVHQLQTWTYKSTVIKHKDVLFDWEYIGYHAFYRAQIKISLVLVKDDDTTETKVLMEGYRRGTIKGNGEELLSTAGCKEYYFQIEGRNIDRDTRLFGTLKVKET